jgi:S-DNA-T family DNA segregation ATPase FtsK/SpoIIIE
MGRMPEKKHRVQGTKSKFKLRREPFYQVEEPGNDWLDRLLRLNLNFGRFARDVTGIVLVAFALMTLLALANVSQGIILTPWASLLSLWFGWGSYLVAVSIGLAGLAILRWGQETFSFGRFIAFEFVLLLTLSLLAILGGNSVERADSGKDGGRVGWGLTTLAWMLGPTWGTLLIVVLWLLAVMSAFGLWLRVERWLMGLAGDVSVVEPKAEPVQEPIEKTPQVEEKSKPKKKPTPLPPEFRKSLHVPKSQDNRPAEPPPRGENYPPFTILSNEQSSRPDERTINQTAGLIEKTLSEFGIPATVIGFRVGPTVTQFAVQPGFIKKTGSDEEDARQMKVRVAQIAALQKDLALALSAERLRIQALKCQIHAQRSSVCVLFWRPRIFIKSNHL